MTCHQRHPPVPPDFIGRRHGLAGVERDSKVCPRPPQTKPLWPGIYSNILATGYRLILPATSQLGPLEEEKNIPLTLSHLYYTQRPLISGLLRGLPSQAAACP